MTTVAVVIAAVALAGVVFLAFGYAGLLTVVRDLQEKLDSSSDPAAARVIGRFAGPGRLFVLVTEPTCASCKDRLLDIIEYLRERPATTLRFAVLQAAPGSRPDGLPAEVEFISDASLAGRLDVSVVPLGIVFDPTGTELGRSILGDRLSFDRLVAEAEVPGAADPQLVGRG